jgi:hypothetical protein
MTAPPRRTARRLIGVVMSAAVLGVAAGAAPAGAADWTVPSGGSVLSNTSGMAGVKCVSATTCLLVGAQYGPSTALAATWVGTTFATVTPVSTTAELYGTDCGPTLCMAVGINSTGGTQIPHAESWNGSNWSSVGSATPSGSVGARLDRVSCPSASFCAAVGWYDNGTIPLPFIEHWTGTSFTLQSLTLPPNVGGAKLVSVSCASATACKAVGYIEVSGQPRKTLVTTWNGSSWAVETSANPAGASLAQLQAVSCPSATACTAVGQYSNGSNVQHALAEVWNGSTWDLQTVPDPGGGATDPTLYGLSCVSSSDCKAVGGSTSSTSHATPLAAAWSGSAWSLQSVPNPTGAADSTLLDVSCTTTCMAVGYAIYDGSLSDITGPRPTVVIGP